MHATTCTCMHAHTCTCTRAHAQGEEHAVTSRKLIESEALLTDEKKEVVNLRERTKELETLLRREEQKTHDVHNQGLANQKEIVTKHERHTTNLQATPPRTRALAHSRTCAMRVRIHVRIQFVYLRNPCKYVCNAEATSAHGGRHEEERH